MLGYGSPAVDPWAGTATKQLAAPPQGSSELQLNTALFATSGCCRFDGHVVSSPSSLQVKYLLGVTYKKQDTLQGEVANIILQLQKGNFKWQEFVMGLAIVLFLISLKLIQRK